MDLDSLLDDPFATDDNQSHKDMMEVERGSCFGDGATKGSSSISMKEFKMEEEEEGEDDDDDDLWEEPSKMKSKGEDVKKKRKKRTLKEDVPLAHRMKHRRHNRLRKRKIIGESESEDGNFKSDADPWTEDEKLSLYKGLKEHGHYDMKQLQTFVPSRSQTQLKKFVQYQMTLSKSKINYQQNKPHINFLSARMNGYNRDVAVDIIQNKSQSKYAFRLLKSSSQTYTNSMHCSNEGNPGERVSFREDDVQAFWCRLLQEISGCLLPDYLRERSDLFRSIHRSQALGHAIYLIREFEKHPAPSDTGGVDIKACYNFLWCCFTRQPRPQLNHATRVFLSVQVMENLQTLDSQSLELVHFMNKLKKDVDELLVRKKTKNCTRSEDSGSVSVEASQFNDNEEKEDFLDLEMIVEDEFLEENSSDPLNLEDVTEPTPVFNRAKNSRQERTRPPRDDHRVVFKHSSDDHIPYPNSSVPSTITPILKHPIYNPLSIPLSALKRY